jgi:O-antigen/teichoic acid export membrane protein
MSQENTPESDRPETGPERRDDAYLDRPVGFVRTQAAKFTRRLPPLSPTKWVTLQNAFEQIFNVVLFAVLAPLLGPRPYGLIGIATIIVAFCEGVMIAVGLDTLISIREIEERHFATMTAINTAFSAALALALVLSADALALAFHDPELAGVMRWMAFLPLLSGFWVAPAAATRRLMRFEPTAMRAIVSLTVSGIVSLILAWAGWGVWALVAQALLYRIIGALILWMAVPIRMEMTFSRTHFRQLWRIAAPMIIGRTMGWLSGQLPRLILGLSLTTTDIGLYNLSMRLRDVLFQTIVAPKPTVARVEFRHIPTHTKELDERFGALLLQIAGITFPLCIGAAAIMPVLFHAWLDARWQPGIQGAQYLMLSTIPFVTFFAATAILLAHGHRRDEAIITTVQAVSAFAAAAVAAPYGINIASAALSVMSFVSIPMALVILKRRCGISAGVIFGAQLPALIAAGAMGGTIWFVRQQISPLVEQHPGPMLLALIALGVVIYVALAALLIPSFIAEQWAMLLRIVALVRRQAGRLA